MSEKPLYITTTLPYVNAKPHIGHALEFVRADAVARFARLSGRDVYFNTGADEHGTKIYQKALEEGKDPQVYVDEQTHLRSMADTLNISYDRFIRTTDEDHMKAAQEFWKVCDANGFIYKKAYTGLYCVGCEMFVTEKDLVNGECPHHPGKKLEEIEEENYFFKYSAFQKELLDLYTQENIVIPESRLNEIKAFAERGLEDFSISRLKEKMPWGVPVPGDDGHVMYVWFDALVNYISTLEWPSTDGNFKKFWQEGEVVQYCGKDNLQHQTARWQAMLLATGLPTSDTIVVNGFVTSGGQKMSKTLGNVIDPMELVEKYGVDALRYYVLREVHPFEDSDMTLERFHEAYTANLVNGLGNLVSRVMKMVTSYDVGYEMTKTSFEEVSSAELFFKKAVEAFDFAKAMDEIWGIIQKSDEYIAQTEPFKTIKTDPEKATEDLLVVIKNIYRVSILLEPFLPDTAQKIQELIKEHKSPNEPLFPRIEI